MGTRRIPHEALIELKQRLGQLPSRGRIRRLLIQETAQLYGVSPDTIKPSFKRKDKTPFGTTN
jgi:hypothetical protein